MDEPWWTTERRWYKEGMPQDMDWRDYFGTDKVVPVELFDSTPRFERKIIEETDRYIIKQTAWGETEKAFKDLESTPEVLDYKIKERRDWLIAKARITYSEDRINWKWLKENYEKYRANGYWMRQIFFFGFDLVHAHVLGSETSLIALAEEPEWLQDIYETISSLQLKMAERVWEEGYRFDEVFWWDDMGYKGAPFFSAQTYRDTLKPFHKRLVDWAHDKGLPTQLHSCGNIMKLLPDIVDTGVDALNPLEVKAGMDGVQIKKDYGDKLILRGGINAQWMHDLDRTIADIEKLVPILMKDGGYMFASDHTIPDDVSIDTMRKIIETVKRVGKY